MLEVGIEFAKRIGSNILGWMMISAILIQVGASEPIFPFQPELAAVSNYVSLFVPFLHKYVIPLILILVTLVVLCSVVMRAALDRQHITWTIIDQKALLMMHIALYVTTCLSVVYMSVRIICADVVFAQEADNLSSLAYPLMIAFSFIAFIGFIGRSFDQWGYACMKRNLR